MHENNLKVIEHWTIKEYADAYYGYLNNWLMVENWYSSIMPEHNDGFDHVFLSLCRKAAQLTRE